MVLSLRHLLRKCHLPHHTRPQAGVQSATARRAALSAAEREAIKKAPEVSLGGKSYEVKS